MRQQGTEATNIDPIPDPGGIDPIYTEPEYPALEPPGGWTEDGLRTTADDAGDPGWYDFSITADGYWYWVVIDDSNFTTDPLVPGSGTLEGFVLTSQFSGSNAGPILGTPGTNLRMLVPTSVGDILADMNKADFGFAEAVIEINKTVYAEQNAGDLSRR